MTDELVLDERLLGAIPSPPDPRDFQLEPKLDLAAKLPVRFLSKLMPPPLNQGNTGRCTSFASTGMKGWEERRDGHGFLPFDAQWLYDHAQRVDGIPLPHVGSTLRANLSTLLKLGEPLVGHAETAPSFRIASYWAVPQTYAAIKAAIAQFGPVVIASRWYRSWFHPMSGVLPEPSGGVVGGHATLAFGWDDGVGGGSLIVRNSWGKAWGVNGNFYAPRRFFVPELHDAYKALDA